MDISDIKRFTEGDCYVLALEINKLTGWPVVDIGQVHAVVKTPCNNYLDIEGLHTKEEVSSKWGLDDFYEFDPNSEEEYFKIWGSHFKNSQEIAEKIALKLVKLYK